MGSFPNREGLAAHGRDAQGRSDVQGQPDRPGRPEAQGGRHGPRLHVRRRGPGRRLAGRHRGQGPALQRGALARHPGLQQADQAVRRGAQGPGRQGRGLHRQPRPAVRPGAVLHRGQHREHQEPLRRPRPQLRRALRRPDPGPADPAPGPRRLRRRPLEQDHLRPRSSPRSPRSPNYEPCLLRCGKPPARDPSTGRRSWAVTAHSCRPPARCRIVPRGRSRCTGVSALCRGVARCSRSTTDRPALRRHQPPRVAARRRAQRARAVAARRCCRPRPRARPAGPTWRATFGRAKNVIFLWLQGGPPQHETFDPKPDAPAEIRGAFRPIATNVPGIQLLRAAAAHRRASPTSWPSSARCARDDDLPRRQRLLGPHRLPVRPRQSRADQADRLALLRLDRQDAQAERDAAGAHVGLAARRDAAQRQRHAGRARRPASSASAGSRSGSSATRPRPTTTIEGLALPPDDAAAAAVRPARPAARRSTGTSTAVERGGALEDCDRHVAGRLRPAHLRQGPRRRSTCSKEPDGAPRPLRPAHAGARACCWPGGWSRRACGWSTSTGRARRATRPSTTRCGTRTPRTPTACRTSSARSSTSASPP